MLYQQISVTEVPEFHREPLLNSASPSSGSALVCMLASTPLRSHVKPAHKYDIAPTRWLVILALALEGSRAAAHQSLSVMRSARAKYHRTVKLHKREELKFCRCTIADASKSSTSLDFRQKIKKIDSVYKVIPSTLDGFSDNSDIADNLANEISEIVFQCISIFPWIDYIACQY